MRTSHPGFRLEMLQVARLCPKLLSDSAALVQRFLETHLTPSGGFGDREGRPDLYYTVFGIEGLLALQLEPPRPQLRAWLQSFGSGAGLDFVHLCSLARSAADIGGVFSEAEQEELAQRLENYRTPDGGFHGSPGRKQGSAYGCLLAWGAYGDLGREVPATEHFRACIASLRAPGGGYANEPGLPTGTTTATAAAVTLCRHLGLPLAGDTSDWLLAQQHSSGGFLATPGAPVPDLLSTAVTLHALDSLQTPLGGIKEACLDFIDTLWTAEGGFYGHWADDHLDCEYTYYGLLALGHLSL